MASLILFKNPLEPHTREVFSIEEGSKPIDWLQEHYPNGFGHPIKFFIGDEEQDLDDLDIPVKSDDVVIIAVMPGAVGAILMPFIGKFLLSFAMSALSSLVAMLFAPKPKQPKKKDKGPANNAYDVSSSQNAARIGSPIPVLYGKLLITPDYASQPYTFYHTEMNQYQETPAKFRELAGGIQYLDILLCLGQGDMTVSKVYVGDTEVSALGSSILQYQVYKAGQHKSALGNINPTFLDVLGNPGRPFSENTFTATEVSGQEFNKNGESHGPFICGKPGQKGKTVEIDLVWPGGLFWAQKADGDVVGYYATALFDFQKYDDNDQPIGKSFRIGYTVSTDYANHWQEGKDWTLQPEHRKGARHVYAADNTTYTTTDIPRIEYATIDKNSASLDSPQRVTFIEHMPSEGRWGVTITRKYNQQPSNRGISKFVWTGLRMPLSYTNQKVYGDVTLMAVRLKASNTIGDDASARISVVASREITKINTGAQGFTANPVDAFNDIYTNAKYGAGRPDTEVDTAVLRAMRTKWAGIAFNKYFTDKITIWDALTDTLEQSAAEPMPLGSVMSIAEDGVKPVRAMMFNEANIVKDTLAMTFEFNSIDANDGFEVEYVEPIAYSQAFALWPSTSINPTRVQLSGCTNPDMAMRHAKLLWNRRRYQRRNISFETEMEGVILRLGDRIGVTHTMPDWGQSGLILAKSASTKTLTADKPLDWTGATTKAVMLRNENGEPSDPIVVTRGSNDYEMVLATAFPFPIQTGETQEFTLFSFGVLASFVRDWTVTGTKPTAKGTVEVKATRYDERIFAEGPVHLGGTQSSTTPWSPTITVSDNPMNSVPRN